MDNKNKLEWEKIEKPSAAGNKEYSMWNILGIMAIIFAGIQLLGSFFFYPSFERKMESIFGKKAHSIVTYILLILVMIVGAIFLLIRLF